MCLWHVLFLKDEPSSQDRGTSIANTPVSSDISALSQTLDDVKSGGEGCPSAAQTPTARSARLPPDICTPTSFGSLPTLQATEMSSHVQSWVNNTANAFPLDTPNSPSRSRKEADTATDQLDGIPLTPLLAADNAQSIDDLGDARSEHTEQPSSPQLEMDEVCSFLPVRLPGPLTSPAAERHLPRKRTRKRSKLIFVIHFRLPHPSR